MKYTITSDVDLENEVVAIGEGWGVVNGIMEDVYVSIINLKEQVVRERLIELGWTPPKEKDSGVL